MDHVGVTTHPSKVGVNLDEARRAEGLRMHNAWKLAGYPEDKRPAMVDGKIELVPVAQARALGF